MKIEFHPNRNGDIEKATGAWLKNFVKALVPHIEVDLIRCRVDSLRHFSFEIVQKNKPTVLNLDTSLSKSPEERARETIDWYNLQGQQRKFARAEHVYADTIMVEKIGAIAAAMCVDAQDFAKTFRNAVTHSYAQVRTDKPNIVIGRSSVEIGPHLIIKMRGDKTHGVIARLPNFQITNQTYTPKIELKIPDTVLLACVGKKLEDVVDAPIFKDTNLIIERACCQGGPNNPNRVSFTIASNLITLDEAVTFIEEYQNKHKE